MAEKRAKLWIVLSFLVPLVVFVLSVMYGLMPRVQLGNIGHAFNFDVIVPWVAPAVGLLFFFNVFKMLIHAKHRIFYSLSYFIYVVLLVHFSLTFSFIYPYNKQYQEGMEKNTFEALVNIFPPEGGPLSQEQAIEKTRNICGSLGYDLNKWSFKCTPSANVYSVNVTPAGSGVDGGLGVEIEKATGKITGIGVISKKSFSLLPRKDFL